MSVSSWVNWLALGGNLGSILYTWQWKRAAQKREELLVHNAAFQRIRAAHIVSNHLGFVEGKEIINAILRETTDPVGLPIAH